MVIFMDAQPQAVPESMQITIGGARMAMAGGMTQLEAGMVLTVEPGLYYPERGFGVHIEDFIYMNPDTRRPETIGEFEI